MIEPKHNLKSKHATQFYLVNIMYALVLLLNLQDDHQLLQDIMLFNPKSQTTVPQHLIACIQVEFQARFKVMENLELQ
jgi:hypothetical protein